MQLKKSDIVDAAVQLFIDQGYHATSIQDILNRSGISKGTFYKHFQSKVELLRASLLYHEDKMNADCNRIVIGEDDTGKEIFIQQLSTMMTYRAESKINALIEDALVSNDSDLIAFIKQMRIRMISWIYVRLNQLFSKQYHEYLMDVTIALSGMLQNMLTMNASLRNPAPIPSICVYCVTQAEELLISVEHKKIKVFETDELEQSFHMLEQPDFSYSELALSTGSIRKLIDKRIDDSERQRMAFDLILFIQEEAAAEDPKASLISSAITTLMNMKEISDSPEMEAYKNTLSKLGFRPI
ncbi:MAG: helix-turn-helix domain containing protein [Candidatus Cohnella colombiensis]|uniref:Helix-turn-helix domain containing protein n=1 Tax=Candidatus Cohnella colombiensis TaxID=3121368 RepID=A0AA95EY83_9BACL|nr:MAG: helix-turn-helix domain containing protein [Cohnella sp.]